jgi:hypothetical protein
MPTPVIGSPTYYRDSLAQVNEAITAVSERGQRYRIGDGPTGREVWRGDLEWLYAERRRLEPLAQNEAAGLTRRRVRRAVPL